MLLQNGLPPSWEGRASVLRPSSPQAHAVHGLFDFQTIVSVIVWIAVVAALVAAIWAANRRREGAAPRYEDMRNWVAIPTVITTLILFVYLAYDFSVGRAVAAPFDNKQVLHISVVGHQWWWEVQYEDTAPQHRLSTSNEIHVPVGRPVLFTLTSQDVIHSFWVPNLNGKRDLIPGHVNDLWFQADTPGVYRGHCAEFCGLEHAKMALIVVAEAPDKYNRWYEAQLSAAAVPTDSERVQGQRVFMSGGCPMCHAIGGTSAGSHVGPELTHVGSRMMLAAGTIPNTRGNLGGWITDPQSIKPGARMPANALPPRDLRAIIAYLEGLK